MFLIDHVDKLLDRVTSYRLVLYFLALLSVLGVFFSFTGDLPFKWHELIFSITALLVSAWLCGFIFSKVLNVYRNQESDLITGLILGLVFTPAGNTKTLGILMLAAASAVASKYLLVLWNRHIFNPAAFGTVVSWLLFSYSASWWVGNKYLAAITIIGGLLILRKIKRFMMFFIFFSIYTLIIALTENSGLAALPDNLWFVLISTPLLFFSIIMLPEPKTSPYSFSKYLPYTILVGVLYSVSSLKIKPELALLIGNLFSFIIAPNRRYSLSFKEKRKEAAGIYSYIFAKPRKFAYQAGQFMEWTVPLNKSDSRGNRRYITLSSSPTENNLKVTLKVPEKKSSFKAALDKFKPGDNLLASDLSGDFTLPKDPRVKMAFMAGGVGITPFRSMVQTLINTGQKRDVVLFYSASSVEELAFKKELEEAKKLGISLHLLSGKNQRLDAEYIKNNLSDFNARFFYISGPLGFVKAIAEAAKLLGVKRSKIKTDYFPGYD